MNQYVRILTERDLEKFINEKVEMGELSELVNFVSDIESKFIKTCYGIVTDYGDYYIRDDHQLIEEITMVANLILGISNYRQAIGES